MAGVGPLADGPGERPVDVVVEQRAQLIRVTRGVEVDDALKGRVRTVEERLAREARVGQLDLGKPRGERRIVDVGEVVAGLLERRLTLGQGNDVVGRFLGL